MKILLTGGSGFVGSGLVTYLKQYQAYEVYAPDSNQLDITNRDNVFRIFKNFNPDVVIHAAAFTDVNSAESQKSQSDKSVCWNVNVVGTQNIVEAVVKSNAYLIHISTGFVTASESEITWYGQTKKVAEEVVSTNRYLKASVIRIDYPFGNPSFEGDYLNKLIKYTKLGYRLLDDQIVTPTYLPDLYKTIAKLVSFKFFGIYSVACEATTPFSIAEHLSYLIEEVQPPLKISFDEFIAGRSQPISRASVLDTRRTCLLLDIQFTSMNDSILEFVHARESFRS